jgi:hypothetical protein
MINEIKKLIDSEIGDFFSGFGNPGEPETVEDMQKKLQQRIDIVFNPYLSGDCCPFCASVQLSVEELKSAWGTGDSEDHVVCDDCAASAPKDVWNDKKGSENA